jgi:DNA mismatch repair ATPase MutL
MFESKPGLAEIIIEELKKMLAKEEASKHSPSEEEKKEEASKHSPSKEEKKKEANKHPPSEEEKKAEANKYPLEGEKTEIVYFSFEASPPPKNSRQSTALKAQKPNAPRTKKGA